MTYTMSDGVVRRADDPDWARPALASEAWAFEEIERLRNRLAELQAEFGYTDSIQTLKIERLTAALKPFADVGQPFIAAAASGAFPAGASARLMKLEPLTAQQFIDAAHTVGEG